MKKSAGFTLIELMIVVAIVAILAAVGYPAYLDHVQRSKRAQAQQFLMDVASREEQYILDARAYTATVGAGGLEMDIPDVVADNYDIVIAVDNAATPPSYTITASPKGQMAGTNDQVLYSTGLKEPATEWE